MRDNNYNLEVGDQFYRMSRGRIIELVTIERLTKTQAVTHNGNPRFKIVQYHNTPIESIGAGDYNTIFYYKRTIELDNKVKKQKLVYKLSNIDWDKYDLDKLTDINTYL